MVLGVPGGPGSAGQCWGWHVKKPNQTQIKKPQHPPLWHKAEPERGDPSDSCSREGLDLKMTSKGKERK